MAVTFGSNTAPSQVTLNLDSLFGTSLAAYKKTLVDNIGATNAFFFEMLKRDLYQSQDGGAYIQEPLMYALAPADSYDGYDELAITPTDGISDAIWQWRQCASPVSYSLKEVKQNKQRILNLVESRIKQTELGLQEYFSQSLMWGAAVTGGLLTSPATSPVNGSLSIDPLFEIIAYVPSAVGTIGNIDQVANTWWRNKTVTSTATTYDSFILEVDRTFNRAALGTGGKPKLILMDEQTYENFVHALYQKYRHLNTVDEAYPFENVVYKGAHFVMDDKVPDVANNIIPTLVGGAGDPSTLTNGTSVFINPDFFKLMYEEESDFELLKDENGKTFQKPVNGDSRVAHCAWMGNLTCSNRRKQSILGAIARTYSS
jgi:hypothetical protein